jgi:seryl-tRNA synthetase
MESGSDIRRLQAENVVLCSDFERRKSERDKYMREIARIREDMGKLGSNLAARKKEFFELQTKHDDALCALSDLRAESARRSASDKAANTVTQAESGKAAAVSDAGLRGLCSLNRSRRKTLRRTRTLSYTYKLR